MKHIIPLLLFFLIITLLPCHAQLMGGGGIVFGSTDEGKFGANLKVLFPIRDRLHLSPNISIFAPDNEESVSADKKVRFTVIDVDAQFHFEVIEGLTLYPLAGLGLSLEKTELTFRTQTDTENSGEVGINLGGGVKYEIIDRLHLFGEGKLTIAGINQAGVFLGAMYTLFD